MKEPTMGLLEELAVRCEAATGADRQLDAEIFACIAEGRDWMRQSPEACRVWASQYTNTVDAAMKLVPDGARWSVGSNGEDAVAWVMRKEDSAGDEELIGAATPALALTAASLRARHALALSKGSEG